MKIYYSIYKELQLARIQKLQYVDYNLIYKELQLEKWSDIFFNHLNTF